MNHHPRTAKHGLIKTHLGRGNGPELQGEAEPPDLKLMRRSNRACRIIFVKKRDSVFGVHGAEDAQERFRRLIFGS